MITLARAEKFASPKVDAPAEMFIDASPALLA
jgi:hypothetical protein